MSCVYDTTYALPVQHLFAPVEGASLSCHPEWRHPGKGERDFLGLLDPEYPGHSRQNIVVAGSGVSVARGPSAVLSVC